MSVSNWSSPHDFYWYRYADTGEVIAEVHVDEAGEGRASVETKWGRIHLHSPEFGTSPKWRSRNAINTKMVVDGMLAGLGIAEADIHGAYRHWRDDEDAEMSRWFGLPPTVGST